MYGSSFCISRSCIIFFTSEYSKRHTLLLHFGKFTWSFKHRAFVDVVCLPECLYNGLSQAISMRFQWVPYGTFQGDAIPWVLSVLAVGIPGFSTPPIGSAGNNQPDFLLQVLIFRVLFNIPELPTHHLFSQKSIFDYRPDLPAGNKLSPKQFFWLSRSANALAVTFFDARHYISDPNHQFGWRFEWPGFTFYPTSSLSVYNSPFLIILLTGNGRSGTSRCISDNNLCHFLLSWPPFWP